MSKTYTMKYGWNRIELTIRKVSGRRVKETTCEPTESTRDRFTRIANLAADRQLPDQQFSLLYSGDGFGWELTIYERRICPDCLKPTLEYQRKEFDAGLCWHCETEKRILAALAADLKV